MTPAATAVMRSTNTVRPSTSTIRATSQTRAFVRTFEVADVNDVVADLDQDASQHCVRNDRSERPSCEYDDQQQHGVKHA